jgi:UDP-N-acetylmuramoyl-L-alanyl-D-glutamate--2,6-diaminopimelate ligase
VINCDDPYGTRLLSAAHHGNQVFSYSLFDSRADFFAGDMARGIGSTKYMLATPAGTTLIHSKLTGTVNVYNQMAAVAAALARDVPFHEAIEAATISEPVPGRFQAVPNNLGVNVLVDYAHTDDALNNLTSIARSHAESQGRVITLFGCGGDRDRAKRPKMGRAAGEGSDFVVVTSDNPRSEDPMAIIEEVLGGLRETGTKFVVEPDRRKAIEVAIRAAKPGDIVLLAGKGHEKTQTFADGAVPFDDVEEAGRVLRELKNEVRA